MSDVFERLKCGSAAHKVKVNSDGSFTLEPLADKDSLKAFQPKAKEALQAASEGQFTIIQTHTSDGRFRKPVRSNHHFPRLAVAAGAFAAFG
jgi:hypothetical protein